MRKIIRFLLAAAACAALVYGTVNMAFYIRESRTSISMNENLIGDAVVVKDSAARAADASGKETEETEDETPKETAPIEVDFEALKKTNKDIIGWLYSEGTPINLPVMQSADNEYYLRRMFDGTGNSAGTLFADYRNAKDFSDSNTIIYGHNMKNKEMFGTLPDYKEQAYFDEHPVLWLLTPDGDYKVVLVAGYVTPTSSEVYSVDQSEEGTLAAIRQAIEYSTFKTEVEIAKGDRFLTLSTCSYEYEDARYVLIGRLEELK